MIGSPHAAASRFERAMRKWSSLTMLTYGMAALGVGLLPLSMVTSSAWGAPSASDAPATGTTRPEDPQTHPVQQTESQQAASPAATQQEPTAPETPRTAQDWSERGRYVAAAADCAACHTAPQGAAYAGGYAFELPIGTLYASNITPDKTHGIGNWTEAQFIRAVREGIRPDGASLYPAMPYPSYARMTDDDLHALYVYFMQSVQPVAQPVQANAIPWPLSMRFPLTLWRWAFAPSPEAARRTTTRPFSDAELARGAYLVEGPGHCGACHTQRGIAMQEEALTAQDGPRYLAGGKAVDGWTPPSLRGEPRTGLGTWSVADITTFLKTGRNARGSAFGNMDSAVHHGTQYLSDADLTAMARYLKTLPAATPRQADWKRSGAATKALQSGGQLTSGQRVYLDNCAACHRSNGAGYPSTFPPLADNPVVMNPAADSIIHIILTGATLQGTQSAPSAFTMPGFAGRLTDMQIAAVATFIRHAWGNNAPAVTDVDVRHMRARLSPARTQVAPPSPVQPAEKRAVLPSPLQPASSGGREQNPEKANQLPAEKAPQPASFPPNSSSDTAHSPYSGGSETE
ncbi:cytochrome c [Acetobacter senegalensis]|uniref:c-type cytochrome n=1 Tax=Acetobacter senegalensis TaxID=446692 RepID=UPI0020A19EE5|nr:cytochrome c [Acetobacter senegalensis]MCP1197216.1 cytochrome c [Acetobacter senegalensis]